MMNHLTSADEIRAIVLARIDQDKQAALEDVLSMFVPFFDEHFKNRMLTSSESEAQGSVRPFGHVGLQQSTHPAIGIVDHEFRPLVGPRLELHLNEGGGLQETRRHLGRIARHVHDRDLAADFPVISAITFPRLAGLAKKVIGMTSALATYIPDSKDAESITSEIASAHRDFLLRPLRSDELSLESLTMPTTDFVERWMSH